MLYVGMCTLLVFSFHLAPVLFTRSIKMRLVVITSEQLRKNKSQLSRKMSLLVLPRYGCDPDPDPGSNRRFRVSGAAYWTWVAENGDARTHLEIPDGCEARQMSVQLHARMSKRS